MLVFIGRFLYKRPYNKKPKHSIPETIISHFIKLIYSTILKRENNPNEYTGHPVFRIKTKNQT